MNDVRRRYLETQIQQASPQQLWLMLLAGAVGFTRRTTAHWQAGEAEEAAGTLLRAKEIAAELYQNVQREGWTGAADMERLYRYIYAEFTALHLDELRARQGDWKVDPAFRSRRVEALIRLLETEVETWSQVCDQHPEILPADAQRRQDFQREITWNGEPAEPNETPAAPAAEHVPPSRPRLMLDPRPSLLGGSLNVDA